MRNLFLTICIICISTFYISEAATSETSTQVKILFARPIDAGNAKNVWFSALADALVRFRTEPIMALHAVPFNTLQTAIPDINHYDKSISDALYYDAASKLQTSHIVHQKFEIVTKDKAVNYYIEIVSQKDKKLVATIEKSFSIDRTGWGLDSCVLAIVEALSVPLGTDAERFFHIPMLSGNSKSFKDFGEVIAADLFTYKKAIDDFSTEYEKIIEKDPQMLLANMHCGLHFFKQENYAKSAKYLQELVDVAPVYTALTIPLVKSYRLSGQPEKALTVTAGLEQNRKLSIPLMIEKALALQDLGHVLQSVQMYQYILMLDPQQPQALLFLAKYNNDNGNAKEALPYANRILSATPTDGKALLEKGRSLLSLNQIDSALSALQKALSALPEDAHINEALGDVYVRKQSFANASACYKKAAPDM